MNANHIIGKTHPSGRDLLRLIPDYPDRLPLEPQCQHCGAKKFYSETMNFCCSNGEVVLSQNKLPNVLKELLTSTLEEAKTFRTMIRTYNNHFGVTSFGVKYDKKLCRRNKGIYTFRIQGQIYHFLNDLNSANDHGENLQLYFHDPEIELANRIASCPRLSETLVKKLMSVLENNPYAKFFRTLSGVPNLDNYHIVLKSIPGLDQRVYNKPTSSQVAALWIEGEDNSQTGKRDIRVHTHSGTSKNIQYYYGCYDPLQYPLMFPFGDLGWHQGIPKKGIKAQTKRLRKKTLTTESICPINVSNVDELLENEEAGK